MLKIRKLRTMKTRLIGLIIRKLRLENTVEAAEPATIKARAEAAEYGTAGATEYVTTGATAENLIRV